ncbi:WD repeat-containing protein 44-like [Senna tora]|uniref:WD repeat-containing protein 44-like n=1 Tax=Senna tora TaxID=362788 RepID=A0A834TKW9_9FABA|nr:WD repeat-containing protein 44-like [Senna tora]
MCKYDVWISEPSSVSERRTRLLREMGLAGDPLLSRGKPDSAVDLAQVGNGEIGRSVSSDHLSRQQQGETSGRTAGVSQAKSDGGAGRIDLPVRCQAHDRCNKSSSTSFCSSILSIHSVSPKTGSFVNSRNQVDKSRCGSGNGPPVASAAFPNKPPSGKNFRRADEIQCGSSNSVEPILEDAGGGGVEKGVDCNGVDRANEQECIIRDLDNGKEFVVKEVREDGMWNKLKEVGTGRQLTMEEFEMTVGHSPIVQELMRRQNVEEGNKDNVDSNSNANVNGSRGCDSKVKKKGSWFKSIKSVASTMTGYKERRNSDERDTSSEKGGRRSSSATDDCQDACAHWPERVRVRQYGKSCKELSALYKSQEIQAHNGSIWSIKFSLDGKYLASAGEDCVIHVWQVVESERKVELLMEKPNYRNMNMLFIMSGSPEPTLLSPLKDINAEKKRTVRSSISRKSLSLDQLVVPETMFALTEKPICSFQGHLDDVLDLSWSKSQHLLSSSMDKTVRLWHLSSNSCLKVFSHSDYDVIYATAIVTCIQFNPVDDRYFISGSLDSKVRIWSIPDRQVVDWTDLHEMVTAACYTPDGQSALVGSYKGSCHLYNTSENKLQQKSQINLQNKKKKSHLKKITGFQFAPGSSSELLITSADSRIRVVDGVDLVHKFKGFRNTNSQILASLTADGKYIVTASEDSHVYVWNNEADCRPNRSKSVSVTQSYEHFHCRDVSVAIPWPGMGGAWEMHDNLSGEQTGVDSNLDEALSANHPPTPVDEFFGTEDSQSASRCNNGPLHGTIASATNSYFFDRISATWPEEKLVLAARKRSPRVSVDITNGVGQNMSAWGLVIVTAGLRGEIRAFQNFGLPVRI